MNNKNVSLTPTTDAEELSTLLLFYTQSSTDLYNFDQDETVKRIAENMKEEIERNYLQGISSSVVNSLGFLAYAWKAGSARMLNFFLRAGEMYFNFLHSPNEKSGELQLNLYMY